MSGGNRMVEKSKRVIKESMLQLMYEKSFNQITVNELLERANISRGTFYAHFANLEDVKQQLINDLYAKADELCAGYKPSELAKDPYPFMYFIADIIVQSRDPAKQLFKFINVYDLGVTLKTWLAKFILDDEELTRRLGGYDNAKIYARFIASGVMHTYNMWITEEDTHIGPEQLARALSSILVGGLNAVLSTEE